MAPRPTIAATIRQILTYIHEFEQIAAAPPLPGDEVIARDFGQLDDCAPLA